MWKAVPNNFSTGCKMTLFGRQGVFWMTQVDTVHKQLHLVFFLTGNGPTNIGVSFFEGHANLRFTVDSHTWSPVWRISFLPLLFLSKVLLLAACALVIASCSNLL